MKKLLFSLILFSVASFAQNTTFNGVAQVRSGLPAPGAKVAVCLQPCTVPAGVSVSNPPSPLAGLCSSISDAVCTSPNPVTADGLGNYSGYIKPGRYTFVFYGSGLTARTQIDQVLPCDPGNCGTLSLTTLNVSGVSTFSGGVVTSNVNGVQYAANYAGASTTCGVAEAYTALPANGGKIILQLGNCSAAGWPVTIQKPIVIEGQGMGGPNDPGTNANVIAGTSLTNTSTGNSFFVISLGAGTSVEGITFRDFAMIGNKQIGGATAGDCVDVNGGTTAQQVRAISFENIQCNQPKGSGFVIKDNAFMINFLNVNVVQSGSHCLIVKDGVNSGVNSQIRITQSTFDLCGGSNASFNPGTADGLNISGTTSREVNIDQSTFADSNNGLNVVAGAINVTLFVSHSDFETNTTCDISLNDGFDHKISGNMLRGTGTGARGICTAMPAGAATQPVQLFMDGNNFSGHTVQDVTIGANQKTCFILPQSSNIYTYADNSGHCVRMDVNQFGILTITAAEVQPAANGATSSGDPSFAWSEVFTFFLGITEGAALTPVGGKDVCGGVTANHDLECSYNGDAASKVIRSTELAAPPAIGGATPAAGSFTTLKGTTVNTTTNCSSSASPAVCGSAAAGSFVIAAAGTSVTVNTSAVTANSQIFVQEDESLGTKLSVTCNTGILANPPAVTARSAGVSFAVGVTAGLAVNPVCFSYWIVN